MVRIGKAALREMTDRIKALGLSTCTICGDEEVGMYATSLPGMLPIGGLFHGADNPSNDPEANTLFLIVITCQKCGHVHLFDIEQLIGRSERILLTAGSPDPDDD